MAQARGAREGAGRIATLTPLPYRGALEQWPGYWPGTWGGVDFEEGTAWGRQPADMPPPEAISMLTPEVNEEVLAQIIQQTRMLAGRDPDPAWILENLVARFPGLSMEMFMDFLDIWFGEPYAGPPEPAEPAEPMAEGGIVTRPTYALLGEEGPEAVIPLDKLKTQREAAATAAAGGVWPTLPAPPGVTEPEPAMPAIPAARAPVAAARVPEAKTPGAQATRAPRAQPQAGAQAAGGGSDDILAEMQRVRERLARLQQQINNQIAALIAEMQAHTAEIEEYTKRANIVLGRARKKAYGNKITTATAAKVDAGLQQSALQVQFQNLGIQYGVILDGLWADYNAALKAEADAAAEEEAGGGDGGPYPGEEIPAGDGGVPGDEGAEAPAQLLILLMDDGTAYLFRNGEVVGRYFGLNDPSNSFDPWTNWQDYVGVPVVNEAQYMDGHWTEHGWVPNA